MTKTTPPSIFQLFVVIPLHTSADGEGYLDEDTGVHEKKVSGKTLARVADARNPKGGGWFTSVGSYLSKNLYW